MNRLRAVFMRGGTSKAVMFRRDDLPEDQCWLRAPGWGLAYR